MATLPTDYSERGAVGKNTADTTTAVHTRLLAASISNSVCALSTVLFFSHWMSIL